MGKNNPWFSAFGADRLRWIENPESVGLRFVGYADEIVSLNHAGWYIDTFQHETARGVVYQLPAHKGVERFVYGFNDAYNDNGAACLRFNITDDKNSAAHWADDLTQRMASEAREDCAKHSAEQRIEDIESEVKETRRDTLALISEIKRNRSTDCPNICAALRARVSSAVDSIIELRNERDRLKRDPWEVVPNY